MMNGTKAIFATVIFVVMLIVFSTLFTVTQGYHAIKLRLGRLVMEPGDKQVLVLGPGLHVKTPFIEQVRAFDTRLQTLDIKSSRVVTQEKKDVLVDYYVKWRIDDLSGYFKSTNGNQLKAETLLEQQLNTLLRAEFGRRTIADVVSGQRDEVMKILRNAAEKQASQLGIFVVDVRIKGIEFPPTTSNAIFQLMRADMEQIANRHRADGRAEAKVIKAKADREATVILANAKSEGQTIRARGEAQASQIYAEAFGQSKAFFEFYRSLLAYQQSFSSKADLLVLDQSSAFFDYFKQGIPKSIGAQGKK